MMKPEILILLSKLYFLNTRCCDPPVDVTWIFRYVYVPHLRADDKLSKQALAFQYVWNTGKQLYKVFSGFTLH